MKDKIPLFLKEKFSENKRVYTNKFPENIKQFMIDYANFYKWDIEDLTLIFRSMQKGYSNKPKCKYNNCSNLVNITKSGTFSSGCSFDHSYRVNYFEKYGVENPMGQETTRQKIKNTMLENHGVEYALQHEKCKLKFKNTMLENHGVEYSMKSDKIKQKSKDTCMEKYGVLNISQLQNIKDKKENTMMINYGCTNSMRSDLIKEKQKLSLYNNYGVDNPMKSNEIKQKSKNTCLLKYGVENAMQEPNILQKAQKAMYKYKTYTWIDGEISMVQGNEPIILTELEENGYRYNDVISNTKDMPEIWYSFEGKKHRYFPDFYIPKENLIIEVKSDYTLKLQWEKNQAKFQAVKDAGFNFRLEVR